MGPECPQGSAAQGQRLGERLRPLDPAGFFYSSPRLRPPTLLGFSILPSSLVPRAKLPISLLRPLFWETYPQLHDCEQSILITVCPAGSPSAGWVGRVGGRDSGGGPSGLTPVTENRLCLHKERSQEGFRGSTCILLDPDQQVCAETTEVGDGPERSLEGGSLLLD